MKASAPRVESVVNLRVERGLPGGRRHGARLEALAFDFFDARGLRRVELSLSVVSDPAIRRLKREWFGVDEATDVLSFPAGDAPAIGLRQLGDIVVSLDTARRGARAFHTTLEQELARYLAHGLLHLLGFDHARPAEARRMEKAEQRLLGGAGMLARSDEVDGP
jgi:probable rRNA maturation factor